MKIQIEITPEEAAMIGYALKEVGNKRAEQAIDWNNNAMRQEARMHYDLSNRVYAATKPA